MCFILQKGSSDSLTGNIERCPEKRVSDLPAMCSENNVFIYGIFRMFRVDL